MEVVRGDMHVGGSRRDVAADRRARLDKLRHNFSFRVRIRQLKLRSQ